MGKTSGPKTPAEVSGSVAPSLITLPTDRVVSDILRVDYIQLVAGDWTNEKTRNKADTTWATNIALGWFAKQRRVWKDNKHQTRKRGSGGWGKEKKAAALALARRDAASDDDGQRQGGTARPGCSCMCTDLFCDTARASLCHRLSTSLRVRTSSSRASSSCTRLTSS